MVVIFILSGLVSYFAYFRKSAPPKPQQTAAVIPAPEVKPDAGAQPSPVQPQAGKQIQPGGGTESQARPAKAQRTREVPLIVADSQLPKTARGSDEAPPAAWNGAGAKLSVPVLPSATTNVVFGGQRSSGAVPAKLIHRVDPVYPQTARSMRLGGIVRLELSIGSDGRVRGIKTLSGSEFLANAATEAVRKWRYEPAKQNGKAVESQVEVQVNFRQ
jgi:protein TonB